MDSVKLQTFPKPERGVCGARVSGSLNNRPQPCDIHSPENRRQFLNKVFPSQLSLWRSPSSLPPTCCQSQNNHNFPSRRGRNGGGRGEGESGIPCTREGPPENWLGFRRAAHLHTSRPSGNEDFGNVLCPSVYPYICVCACVCTRAHPTACQP